MPRAKRLLYDNSVFHIIQRGHNKERLFKHSKDYKSFKDIIRKYKNKYSFDIYHYCIMSNHFHFVLKIIKGKMLPKVIQGITQSYSFYYKRRYHHIGYLYQNRYKSFLIKDNAYLLECGRYIERNPIRAKIVKDPKDYYWSSYNFYSKGKHDDIITISPLYEALAKTPQQRQKAYIEYVSKPRLYEVLVDEVLTN
jgi:putative transposase